MKDESLCPCSSGLLFTDCCQPVLTDQKLAVTAEMLMRSRYSGFVMHHSDHIRASWHPTTRPRQLNFDNHPVQWLGLEIHSCEAGQQHDSSGTVEFTSSYLENGQLCKLRETSQFVKENDLWYYLRGECTVSKGKVERNKPCPCGSKKKFKRCCLNK